MQPTNTNFFGFRNARHLYEETPTPATSAQARDLLLAQIRAISAEINHRNQQALHDRLQQYFAFSFKLAMMIDRT